MAVVIGDAQDNNGQTSTIRLSYSKASDRIRTTFPTYGGNYGQGPQFKGNVTYLKEFDTYDEAKDLRVFSPKSSDIFTVPSADGFTTDKQEAVSGETVTLIPNQGYSVGTITHSYSAGR